MTPPKMLTFDCYGTLIDWEEGITAAFASEASRDAVRLERARVLHAYAEAEAEVERGPWRPYREVLREAALAAAGRLGWALAQERAAFLAESLPGWRPFPETNPALKRLARSCRLGILSNVDDDLLDATREQLEVDFDPIVTAEQVRSYKPRHAHWIEARRLTGETSWTHVAQSHYHDVVPAVELGLSVVWVNRGRQSLAPGDPLPTHEVADLAGAADVILGRDG